ncbi:MAG: ABC transporter ATP-binding protein [bacterium]|nr:ABC transporter ATP-binding protein [bacterium]
MTAQVKVNRQDIFSDVSSNVGDKFLIFMLLGFLRPYVVKLLIVFVMLIGVTAVSLLPPYLIQLAVDGPMKAGSVSGLLPYAIAYILCVPILFALRFGHIYLLQTVGQNALADLRQKMFEHILKQDMRFFNKTPVGQLVARLSSDIESLTELLSTSIVIVVSNLITLVGIIGVMFALNWRMAILGLAMLPIMAVSTLYYRKRIREETRTLHKLVGDYQAFINEQSGGMLIVQLFGRQELSRQEFDTINTEYLVVQNKVRDQYTNFSSVLQVLTTLGLVIVLYGGAQGVAAGWASLGMLISFIEYTRRSFTPILQLSEQFSQIQSALSAGERIARLLKTEPRILEAENPKPSEHVPHSITLEKVEFHYDDDAPVLRGIDLTIPEGQRVAIVGATGAGKTSLAGLIARFYDVTGGSIKIGGVDVREMSLDDLRKHVMVVPQIPYCFDGTIADNLMLFNPNITREQMIAGAQAACASKFIEKLPNTYDYKLLPGGANLSQGQRQLLALARALIHNPNSILVLDEATSNIDTETEALIQEGLAHVLEGRTSIIIAHRLSTVRDADRILVMKQGLIVEDGTHDELLAQGGLYSHLYHRQFDETEVNEAETSAYLR